MGTRSAFADFYGVSVPTWTISKWEDVHTIARQPQHTPLMEITSHSAWDTEGLNYYISYYKSYHYFVLDFIIEIHGT